MDLYLHMHKAKKDHFRLIRTLNKWIHKKTHRARPVRVHSQLIKKRLEHILLYLSWPGSQCAMFAVYSGVHVLLVSLFGRSIVRSISHFFGRPILFLVDQKPISNFFGRPIFFLVNQKPFSQGFCQPIFFWSNKFIFSQPKKKLIDQKHEKMFFLTKQKICLPKK